MGEELAKKAVDTLETYAGATRGYRRAHARGLVLRGTFQATAEASALSRAEHFSGVAVACTVRLSNAGGDPLTADRASDRAGRGLGLGIRFALPSGATASWAAVNLPSFVARTPEDFLRITRASKPFLFGQPNPLLIIAHLIRCPSALAAIKYVTSMKPAASFAAVTYFGIHSYMLVNAQGERQPFRYFWQPRLALAPLTKEQCQRLPPLYLCDELRERVKTGAIEWDLMFQFPQPGDPLDDATRAWPDDRKTVKAGTLRLTEVADQRASELLVFDPTGVVPGVELSGDPLLRFRAEAYSESYARRSQEARVVPAPADMLQS